MQLTNITRKFRLQNNSRLDGRLSAGGLKQKLISDIRKQIPPPVLQIRNQTNVHSPEIEADNKQGQEHSVNRILCDFQKKTMLKSEKKICRLGKYRIFSSVCMFKPPENY
jgi:hypothetical protein